MNKGHDNDYSLSKWAETWKKAEIALQKIKQKELTEYNYQENKRIVDDLLQLAVKKSKIKLYSGLVEQQRLFNKKRHL